MSQFVLFNGAVLVRPGASTKIDASQFQNIALSGLGIVGLIGEADGGEPRTVEIFTSPAGVKAFYESGDLVNAAAIVAAPGNDPRIPAGASAIVCYKVNNSAAAALTKNAHVMSARSYGLRGNSLTASASIGAAALITSASTGVGANTLTDAGQALVVNAYAGMYLMSSAGVVYLIVSNTATIFTVAAGGAAVAAGAYTVHTNHPYGRIISFTGLDADGVLIVETSSQVGHLGKFTMQYTGAGTPCAVTVTSTALTTTCTGAGADDLNLLFADYPTLDLLIRAIDAHANYTATALVTNAPSFLSVDLDTVTVLDAKVITTPIMATNFDIGDWINKNSAYVTDTVTAGQAGLMTAFALASFTGGTRGTSANSNWVDGFTALRSVRINQIVPLASTDATTAQGSFTYASILASLVAHAKFVSSTAGRNEGQAWSGMEGTKTELIAAANLANSEHLCLFGQKPLMQRMTDGEIVEFPEWAAALSAAGMRAGAPLGEPITWKYGQMFGVSSDDSWSESNNDDVVALTLNGVMVINNIQGKGFRFDKGITTFTKSDNDAYTEETIVQIWKNVAYELRSTLEDVYVGRPGSMQTVQTVPAVVSRVLELFRQSGAITDSLINGVTIKAYRAITVSLNGDQLSVGVTISPTPGINFVLNTIVLVPAQISLT